MKDSTKEAVKRELARDSEHTASRRGVEATVDGGVNTKEKSGLFLAVGSGVSETDARRERFNGVTGIASVEPKNRGKRCLDAQQISFMRFFNHRLHSGAHSLEKSKVDILRRMLLRISIANQVGLQRRQVGEEAT